MASSDLRYGTNSTNTSKFMTDLLNEFTKMPRGSFDLRRRKSMDVTPFAITPIECWEMLPNSDIYVNYDIQMISKNPTVKRLLSSMTAELRVYKCNHNDCWEGWNNFITKGRSGKVSLSVPYVDFSLGSNDVTTSLMYSPAELMRMAPAVFLGSDTGGKKFTVVDNEGVQLVSGMQSSGKTGISTLATLKASTAMRITALPFVMLNKINKKYQQSNLLQNNPHWYPENENHDMILPYSATGAVTTSDYDNPTKAFVSGTSLVRPSAQEASPGVFESYPWLNVMQYAQRKGDYFNTGSPFPDLIRGDIPTLQVLNASINWDNVIESDVSLSARGLLSVSDNQKLGILNYNNAGSGTGAGVSINYRASDVSTVSNGWSTRPYSSTDLSDSDTFKNLKDVLDKATVSGIEFSMAQWRYLATMTVMRERLALTDGSYNEMIKAMFGHNPRWHNHDVQYCGGCKQSIVFSEVVNTTESATAPLGDTAGRAISAQQNQLIHVHSDDYAYYMAVLVITPDEYYSQGVDKMFSRLENSEQYFPILNNLSPDATRNKELYVSGNNTTDEDVFNYQERFAYYKSRRNEVAGLMSLAISKIGDIGAYIAQRLFSSTPDFNAEFNEGYLTDNEKAIFASTNQAQFCTVIGSNMRFVGPIPEDSRPSDMGISY